MVVQAYILVQTNVGKAAEVAHAIGAIQGVTLAEDVTGPYDVLVRAQVPLDARKRASEGGVADRGLLGADDHQQGARREPPKALVEALARLHGLRAGRLPARARERVLHLGRERAQGNRDDEPGEHDRADMGRGGRRHRATVGPYGRVVASSRSRCGSNGGVRGVCSTEKRGAQNAREGRSAPRFPGGGAGRLAAEVRGQLKRGPHPEDAGPRSPRERHRGPRRPWP